MNHFYSNLKLFLVALFTLVGASAWADSWVQTAPGDLKSGDVVVIVDQTTATAMSNDKGTSSAPAATPVALSESKSELTGSVEANLQWVVTVDATSYRFNVPDTEKYLYCIGSNNGVRVGTNSANTFTIADHDGVDFLQHTGTNRFLGVYSQGNDWRCYTSVNSNISSCVLAFYKKSTGEAPSISAPVFTPKGGLFNGSQDVSISCETEGATIYYTTDGTDPTTESSVYSEALSIASTTTIKAIAAKESELSNVASATFTKRAECSTLAELLALENNTPFVFNGEPIVVATPSSRYVYVKDSDNAALIYDATGQNTASLYEGYTITGGWNGKVTIFNGLFELIPDDVLAQETGGAVKVEYPVVTAADITSENANKVVTLKGVTAYTAGNGKNGTFFIGETAIAAYNQFNIDMSAWVEGQTYDIVGAISRYNDNVQFQPISFTEAEDAPAATVLALTAAAGAYPAGNNFVNTWTSNTEPVVTVTASANNMDRRVTEHFAWYSGLSKSGTYTFSVPGGYMITAISLKAKASSDDQTATIGENQKVFTTEEAEMAVDGLSSARVVLTLSGENKGLLISQIMVTVAEDPNYIPPVASVEELTNGKAYSLVVPRGSLGVNAEKLVATNVAGNEASNFALLSYNDKLYLYSIAANAFIAKDGKLTTTAPCAITLKALGESRFQFFLGDNCLNVSGSSVLIDSWTTVDDGNKFFITPVEDYDASNALTTLETLFSNTVVYEISDANGVVFTSEAAPATLGAEITELPADFQRAFCTYDVTPTTIVAGENTVKVTVNYKTPFTVSKDFDNATWYYATIRGNKYLRADDSAKDASNRYQTSSTNGGGNEYKWAFGGNPYTGFIIMNRGIGAEKVLYMGAQPEFQALNAEDIKCFWTVVANGDGFNVRSLTGATMYINDNANGGNIGTWNSTNGATDAGGRWNISAVPEYEISIAEGLENGNIITSRATYQANDEVQLNIQPAEGYRLKTLTVMAGEEEVRVADDNTFVMPAANVTVSATFDKMVYIETDLTSQFSALTNATNWVNGTGGNQDYAGWAAPEVTVNGSKVKLIENYVEGQAAKQATGDVMYQTVEGLSAGTYSIELYGAANLTAGRSDMTTDFTEGDEASLKAVYLYAETTAGVVKKYIPCLIEDNFNHRGGEEAVPTAKLEGIVVGEDGKVKIGIYKEVGLTNWHFVQLKSVIATVDADYALAPHVSAARAISQVDVPAVLFGEIEMTINSYDNRFETEQEYLDAIAALDAVVAKAKAYKPLTDILAKGEDYKAHVAEGNEAVAIYDAAIADVKAAYDAVTVDDFAAAIATVKAALPALAKAQTKAGADMTAFIVNPEINGADGWTCEKPLGGNGPLLSGTAFEYWAGNASDRAKASFDYYQVIENVPNGFYAVSAEMYNSTNGEDGAVFSATSGIYVSSGKNEVSKLVDVDGTELIRYTTDQIFVSDGTLRIGVKNVETPMSARWFVADNFTLTLIEPANPEPKNLDFAETEAIDNAVTTYAKDMAKNSTTYFGAQAVDSWTALNLSDNLAPETGDSRGELDQRAGAVVAYGSTAWLGGSANVAPAAGPEGSNGKGLGMVAVWTATVQYTQPVTLDAGTYTLEIPVYNSVGGTTVPAKSLIGFIASDGTEYLAPAKAYAVNTWTTETVTFTLDKTTNGVFSLGYTMTNNGNGNAPHLFFDCINIITDQREALRTELKAALSVAQATIEAKANVGDKLFQKPEAAFEVFNRSVIAQQAVAENEEATAEQLQTAIATLADASAAYDAALNTPAADQAYAIKNNSAEGNLSIHDGTVTIEEGAKVFFTAVEGGYALSNEDGKYVFKTTANTWTLATTENLNEAYVINANLVEGGYTLQGANGLMGTDNTTAGSAVYANKTAANNGVWTIEEWALPAVVLNGPTLNAENGTQTEPKMYPSDFKLMVNYSAENLEANGYNADDLKVKVTVLVSGDLPENIMNMQSETRHSVLPTQPFYIDLGQTDFPVELKQGYVYQNIVVTSATLVKPATEVTEEVTIATYAGAPVQLHWIGIAPAVKLTVAANIESGTAEEPGTSKGFTTVEAGSEFKLMVSAENLEANGLNPEELTLEIGMVMESMFTDPSWPMGVPNTSSRIMKQNVVVPFAEEIVLEDVVFDKNFPFIQSINLAGITLKKGDETITSINEALVVRFIEVYENGLPVGINGIQADGEKATIYDLSGRKVEKMVKGGIYIVNGKKVSFK